MDESLLLLQYALTGETLKGSIIEKARLKDQYFDSEGWSFFYSTRDLFFIFDPGNLVKAKMNSYPQQTLSTLLTQHTDLRPIQVEAAARFIMDCLRLNPSDRLTVGQVDEHCWLETAFMGGMEEEDTF